MVGIFAKIFKLKTDLSFCIFINSPLSRSFFCCDLCIYLVAVVSLMNGKYKWIVNESRRLHEAGVTPAVCDKILYEHAIELVRFEFHTFF